MLNQMQIRSNVLNQEMGVNVILPDVDVATIQGHPKFPVLYLLHGYSDNCHAWIRKTSIERFACDRGIAVVMPEGYKTFYINDKNGAPYFDFLSQELPRALEWYLPIADTAADRYVAGLSMGGYGSFKWAFTCPDQFAAAASLSGALDIARVAAEYLPPEHAEVAAYGGQNDLFSLATQPAVKQLPLYQTCGTEDFLYEDNIRFRDFAKEEGLTLTYHEEPGAHDWDYWNRNIERVLDWILKNREGSVV